MKKAMSIIAGFAVVLTFLSAFSDGSLRAKVGSEVPIVVAEKAFGADSSAVAPLSSLKGKKVILSFWSASDAQSRITQNMAISAAKGTTVEVVSVNFDRSERLMREIVRLDGLSETLQYRVASADTRLALCEAFSMNSGLRTFLVDEEGRIVAVDPSSEEISHFVEQV